jgi:hypothetical protein
MEEWKAFERQAFTPEAIKDFKEAANRLRKQLPWLDAPRQEARFVAVRVGFPRSKLGKYQNDLLARAIMSASKSTLDPFGSIVKAAEKALAGPAELSRGLKEIQVDGALPPPGTMAFYLAEWVQCLYYGEAFNPTTRAEFFQAIAERLSYLDRFKPNAGDFAVEELQGSFVGLMSSKRYGWKENKYPAKGEVIAMAESFLERKNIAVKSGWTEHLRKADLVWLPEGRAGRPTKTEVDKVGAAKKAALAKITKLVNACGGDWSSINAKLGKAFGKNAAMDAEGERLEQYTKPPSLDEKGG